VCDYAESKRSLIFVPILLQYPGQDQKGNQAQGTHAWNVARNELKELMKLQKLYGDFAIWILSAVAAEEVEQKPWHLSFIL
jgi:hypothetical protein